MWLLSCSCAVFSQSLDFFLHSENGARACWRGVDGMDRDGRSQCEPATVQEVPSKVTAEVIMVPTVRLFVSHISFLEGNCDQ